MKSKEKMFGMLPCKEFTTYALEVIPLSYSHNAVYREFVDAWVLLQASHGVEISLSFHRILKTHDVVCEMFLPRSFSQ